MWLSLLLYTAMVPPPSKTETINIRRLLAEHTEVEPTHGLLKTIEAGKVKAEFFIVRAGHQGPPPVGACGLLLKLTEGGLIEEQLVDASELRPFRAALQDFTDGIKPGVTGGIFPGESGIAASFYRHREGNGIVIWSRRSGRAKRFDLPGVGFSAIPEVIDAAIGEFYEQPASAASRPKCNVPVQPPSVDGR